MGCNQVKPEQASKVLMRMPTLRSFGEGRTCGEVIEHAHPRDPPG
jgi:hypothetical protein